MSCFKERECINLYLKLNISECYERLAPPDSVTCARALDVGFCWLLLGVGQTGQDAVLAHSDTVTEATQLRL